MGHMIWFISLRSDEAAISYGSYNMVHIIWIIWYDIYRRMFMNVKEFLGPSIEKYSDFVMVVFSASICRLKMSKSK